MSFNLPFGVRIAGNDPVDFDRYIADTIAARDSLITAERAYEGLQVYVEADKTLYILKDVVNSLWEPVGAVMTINSIPHSEELVFGNPVGDVMTHTQILPVTYSLGAAATPGFLTIKYTTTSSSINFPNEWIILNGEIVPNTLNVIVLFYDGADVLISISQEVTEVTGPVAITPLIYSHNTTANQVVSLPLNSGLVYNLLVDWGDGSSEETITDPTTTHTYTDAGVYDISITPAATGGFPSVTFNNLATKASVNEVKQFGTNPYTTLVSSFRGLGAAIFTATDAPVLSLASNASAMFRDSNQLGNGGSTWDGSLLDTSSIQNMSRIFQSTPNLDPVIFGWNVENVTNGTFAFLNSGLSTANYDLALTQWALQSLQSNVTFEFGNTLYTSGESHAGTTTSAGGDLVDTGNDFSTVSVGDIVVVNGQYSRVDTVSTNTLTLVPSLTINSGDAYSVQTSNEAKGKATMVIDFNWTITDGGWNV